LFVKEDRGGLRLEEKIWEREGALSESKAESLIKPFSEQEIKAALDDMKTNSAPGLDGLLVEFCKGSFGIISYVFPMKILCSK
jgi:hypothetical protein